MQRIFPNIFTTNRSSLAGMGVLGHPSSFSNHIFIALFPSLILTPIGAYLIKLGIFTSSCTYNLSPYFCVPNAYFASLEGIIGVIFISMFILGSVPSDLVLLRNPYFYDFLKDYKKFGLYRSAIQKRIYGEDMEIKYSLTKKGKVKVRFPLGIYIKAVVFQYSELFNNYKKLSIIQDGLLLLLLREDRKTEIPGYHISELLKANSEISTVISEKEINQLNNYFQDLLTTIFEDKSFADEDKKFFIEVLKKLVDEDRDFRNTLLGKVILNRLEGKVIDFTGGNPTENFKPVKIKIFSKKACFAL